MTLIESSYKRIGIGDETLAAIRKVRDEVRPTEEANQEKLRKEWDALRELLAQDLPDEKALLKQAESIGALSTKAQKQRLQNSIHIRSLMTPQERSMYVKLRARGPIARGRSPGRPRGGGGAD